MARAADGTYTNPNTLVPNTLANATKVQENFDAIALALTDSLSRTGDGGLETDTSSRDYALSVGQAQDGKPSWGGTATGTTSAIVVTLTPTPTAIVAGMEVAFLMAGSANAAAATLDIGITTGAPPVAVTYPIRRIDGTAIQAGDLAAGAMVTLRCDGTGFRVHSIVQGDVGQTLGTTVRTTDATLGNADNATAQDCTAAAVLTLDLAATLTAGWFGYVRNNTTASAVTVRGYRYADQATNGSFSSGSTGWTLGSGWSVGSAAVGTATSASLSQAQTLVVGALYEVVYTIASWTAGTVQARLTGGTTVSGTANGANGTYTEYLRAVTGNATLDFLGASFSGQVDNIALRRVEEIDGAHTLSVAPGETRLVWCDGTTSRNIRAGSRPTQFDLYTATDTWTKPPGAVAVYVEVVGAGGGGGGGARTASTSTAASGAGGGGAGSLSARRFRASDLSATVAVTVAAGGAGGTGKTSTDGTGAVGSNGGNSSFGSDVTGYGGGGGQVTIGGGGGGLQGAGAGGTVGAGGGGAGSSAGGVDVLTSVGAGGGAGDPGGVGAAGSNGLAALGGGGAGGGGGASVTSSNVAAAAGLGGVTLAARTAATAGNAGTSPSGQGGQGSGGGGGGGGTASTSAAGGVGGAGGAPGGGGGGGAGGRTAGGNGGVGGRGEVRVWTFF